MKSKFTWWWLRNFTFRKSRKKITFTNNWFTPGDVISSVGNDGFIEYVCLGKDWYVLKSKFKKS